MKYLFAITAAAIGLMTFAGAASAATYCVGAGACDVAETYPLNKLGLEDALDKASSAVFSPGADQIEIAAGTIELGAGSVALDPPTGEALSVTGAGIDKTIIHSETPDDRGLDIYAGNATVTLSDLTVRVDGAQTTTREAVDSNQGELTNVEFELTSTDGNTTEGFSGSGSCSDCIFALKGDAAEAGYADGNMTIERSRVYNAGLPTTTNVSGFRQAGGANLQVFHSTITGTRTALSTDNGTITLSDSVVDMGSLDDARGVVANNPNDPINNTVAADLNSATITGTGANQIAVYSDARTTGTSETAALTLRDSILYTVGSGSKDIACYEGTNGHSTALIGFSLYGAAHTYFDAGCDWTTATNSPVVGLPLTDLFVAPASGDFRLKPPPNPAIDVGNWNNTCGARVDLLGDPRCVNGATKVPQDFKIDIGAVEYQNYRPDVPVITAPATGTAEEALSFSATATDANGDPVTLNWDFGDGGQSALTAPQHTFAKPGTYIVTVIANDGVRDSASASAKVTISARPPIFAIPPIGWFKLGKPSGKFKLAKKPKAFTIGVAKPKVGIPVDTNSPGLLTFTLVQVKGGYASGKKCVKAKPKTGKAKRCSLKLKGSQQLMVPSGISYLSFSGRWNKKSLKPGKYMLSTRGASSTFTLAK